MSPGFPFDAPPVRCARLAVFVAVLASMAFSDAPLRADENPSAQIKEGQPRLSTEVKGALPPDSLVVTGEVVREDLPVAGALVLLLETRLHQTVTDDKGRFRFEGVPRREYRLWTRKDELVSSMLVIDSPGADGAMPPVRLAMSPGRQMQLTVRSTVTGEPLEGAAIRLLHFDRRTAVTDKAGSAIISGLFPDLYSITVDGIGHARQVREIDLANATQLSTQAFNLISGGQVRGVVLDDDGKPLEGANVRYRIEGAPGTESGGAPRTDPRGQFEHLYLPLSRRIEIRVRHPEFLATTTECELSADQTAKQVELRLNRRPRGGSISGVVLGPDDKPISGVLVQNSTFDSDIKREVVTGEDGDFVLHDLIETSSGVQIVVRARKFVPLLQRVEPGPENAPTKLTIRLQVGHSIRGQVVSEEGIPLKGARVALNRLAGNGLSQSMRTSDDGTFEFDSLPANSRFTIFAPGFSQVEDRELVLDGAEPVVISLEPSGKLSGRVVDAETGDAIPDFRIRGGFSPRALRSDPRGTLSANFADPGLTFRSDQGEFLLRDLVKGFPLQIIVEAEGYERAVFDRVVPGRPEGDDVSKVALRKVNPANSATMNGKIVDHRVKPVAGAQLRLIVSTEQSKGGSDNRFSWGLIKSEQLARKGYVDQYLDAVSDADGKFEFKGLLPGKHLQLVYWGDSLPSGRWLKFSKTIAAEGQHVFIQAPEPARILGSFAPDSFPGAREVQLKHRSEARLDFQSKLHGDRREFHFENLPPGEYQLVVMAQAEREIANPTRSAGNRRLTIEPGSTTEVRFSKDDVPNGP